MTQKEIAKALNITQAAVSMALKGSNRISPALRQSVHELAVNTGYRPNLAGQMLRRKRSNVIGAVFPRLSNQFYAELFQEIQKHLLPHGYMLYSAPAEKPEELEKVVENLRQMSVAGVIAFAAREFRLLRALREAGIALVLYGGDDKLNAGVSQVLPDRFSASLKLVRHLLANGRRNIIFFGSTSRKEQRVQAYTTALAEAGLKPICIPQKGNSCRSAMETAFDTMKEYLAEHQETDAVFAHNDELALAVKRAIMTSGRSIPGDIALAGFDNIPVGNYLTPSLTTIEQPLGMIADALITELLATIRDPSHARFVSVPCSIVFREST